MGRKYENDYKKKKSLEYKQMTTIFRFWPIKNADLKT